jgi:hypothetical protein
MNPLAFLDILDSHLSEEELMRLCRQFGVAYAAFPGATQRDKTREFVGFAQRQGRLVGLAEAVVALRPDLAGPVASLFESKENDLAWLDEIAPENGQALESGLTWRWTGAASPRAENAPPPAASAATNAPANPYTPGRRVADEAMFFGRAEEREEIRRRLLERGHVAIVSGRGFGGSSLLHDLARRIEGEKGVLVAVVDMKDPAHQTLAGLLNAAWGQWWRRVNPHQTVHARTLADFVTAARKLNAAGFRPLLFLDELEQLVWRPAAFDDHLFDAWEELGRQGVMGFALSSHASPADLMAQGELASKFYDLFQPLNLGLLDEPAARDLLTIPIERAGLTVPEGAVDDLLARAGPQPFFLHLAGLYLYDALVRPAYVRKDVAAHFEAAAEPYWEELWDALSPLAQSHYPAGRVRAAGDMAGRQLRILANKGLLIEDASGFRPFSQGFARWVGRVRAATAAAAAVRDTPPAA